MTTEEERLRELDNMEIDKLKGLYFEYESLPNGITRISPRRMKATIIDYEFPADDNPDGDDSASEE